jgi:hypothetical protein
MIKINCLIKSFEIPFDPNEPIWSFSRRTMNLIPQARSGVVDTCHFFYLYSDKDHSRILNTYDQRLMRIGDIVTDPTRGLLANSWFLMGEEDHLRFVGNSSPASTGDRSICAICLDAIVYTRDNGLFPISLRCGHIFHQACVERLAICPLCRKPK